MSSLLAVVVSYGATPQLPGLLSALAEMADCQVVLVENSSAPVPEELPAAVRVHRGHGNVGYGTAVNLAVRRHLEQGEAADWLLVVNSDISIPPDTGEMLPKLLAEAPGDADVMGFAFRTPDGRPDLGWGFFPSRRANAHRIVRGLDSTVARWPELRYPSGAFFAVRLPAFLRVGGFDPAYWMYYEETDLFARLRAVGGRTVWADGSWPVVHGGGATAGRAPMLHVELGRAATVYARRHPREVGRGWLGVVAVQLLLLAAQHLVGRRPAETARALRMLAGLVGGLALPHWEPAPRSRWRAVPASTRAVLGRLPGPAASG